MPARPYYLELVTSDVDAVCALHTAAHGADFSDPTPALGGARIAALPNGCRLGVRAPMRPDEAPVTRVYLAVDDLRAATDAARDAGAVVAMDAVPLGEHGQISIVLQGGIDHGLWQPPG